MKTSWRRKINRRRSPNFSSPFYTKVKEWLNVESFAVFFPCQGEIKIYARMPNDSPPRVRFSRNSNSKKKIVELIDNFFESGSVWDCCSWKYRSNIRSYTTTRIKINYRFLHTQKASTEVVYIFRETCSTCTNNTTRGKFLNDKTWCLINIQEK